MKELSVEEKAKRYDEAVKAAESLCKITTSLPIKEYMESIFHELKESEDERIRKAIKSVVSYNVGNNKIYGVSKEDMIAWLEKQGEQKSADKVKPKFKVGDWIQIERGHVMKILDVDEEIPCYVILNWYGGQSVRSISDIDSISHLWTIQDAKDGDVLSFNDGHGNDCIELIKSITEKKIEFWFCLTNGNYYEVFDGITPYTNFASREDATPATKEQRDLLFQKMKEAGYVWDAEKKELKKIEQKPTDVRTTGYWHVEDTEQNPVWSEDDENRFRNLIYLVEHSDEGKATKEGFVKFINRLKSFNPSKQE